MLRYLEDGSMGPCTCRAEGQLLRVTIKRLSVDSYVCKKCDVIWYRHADAGNTRGARADVLLAWLGYEASDRDLAMTVHGPVAWPR